MQPNTHVIEITTPAALPVEAPIKDKRYPQVCMTLPSTNAIAKFLQSPH